MLSRLKHPFTDTELMLRLEEKFQCKVDNIPLGSLVRNTKSPVKTRICRPNSKMGRVGFGQVGLGRVGMNDLPSSYAAGLSELSDMTEVDRKHGSLFQPKYVYTSRITASSCYIRTCKINRHRLESILQMDEPRVAKERLDAFLEERDLYLVIDYKSAVDPEVKITRKKDIKAANARTSVLVDTFLHGASRGETNSWSKCYDHGTSGPWARQAGNLDLWWALGHVVDHGGS
ncbi:uncharacterized protein LY89DRAFT_692181 [Mollisia scopiformis]|uniref:Uncharacterized protein n=1 Tax=Mollisia scopiformis TaxID=149040 RepID=A0A132B354_MOLSC|nr:uncharacterized protein LY89DRAFT_692181 [Mollisia scopiformis]KUJ06826.1 hypothetical protein LY89DRAFT_692181 [Mollisia scopiformis]